MTNEGNKYGDHAVEHLAGEVGLDRSTAYRHADVAGAWTEEAFTELGQRRNSRGMPLSWSHFTVLARVKSSERESLLEAVFAESLAVRALKQRISMTKGESRASLPASSKGRDATARMQRELDILVERAETWKRTFCPSASATRLEPEARDEVRAALEKCTRLRRLADEMSDGLQKAFAATPAPNIPAAVQTLAEAPGGATAPMTASTPPVSAARHYCVPVPVVTPLHQGNPHFGSIARLP